MRHLRMFWRPPTATVPHRPRLLSDNGASYIYGDFASWLEQKGMDHVRGAPNHAQTQGKIWNSSGLWTLFCR